MVRALMIALVVQVGRVGWAEACDGCTPGWHAPADGTTIPASTLALFSTDRANGVTLRDEAGRLVPVTFERE